jgi:hypothetical protein
MKRACSSGDSDTMPFFSPRRQRGEDLVADSEVGMVHVLGFDDALEPKSQAAKLIGSHGFSGRVYCNAPVGQRSTCAATSSAGAASGATHRLRLMSNTAGRPRTHFPV